MINIFTILKHLLPLVEIRQDNANVWERLVQVLSYPDCLVKRASMNAIKNIISINDIQAQAIIEFGLIPQLTELLINQNQDVRIDACSILVSLGLKGYTWVNRN